MIHLIDRVQKIRARQPHNVAALPAAMALALAYASVPARADISPGAPTLLSVGSSPVMSPLASGFHSGASLMPTSGPVLLPFKISQGDSLSLGNPSAAGNPNLGVSLFYYNSGSDPISSHGLLQSSSTYGIVDHLSLLSPKAGGAGGSLDLKGQFYLSSAGATPGLTQSTKNNQAYDQNVSYSGRNIAISATVSNIGKNFADGGAFTTALASGDQATRDAAQNLLSRKGQTEQKLSMDLGNAKSGLLSLQYDGLKDSVNNKNTVNEALGFNWGDPGRTQFSFQDTNAVDRIAHAHNQSQTFGLHQMIGSSLALTAMHATQSQGNSSSSLTNTTDRLQMSLSPKQMGFGVDFTSQMAHDSLGGYDRQMGFNLKRDVGGVTLGLQYGDESRRVVSSSGATPALAAIHTMGYTVEKRINSLISIKSNWLATTDTSRAPGQQRFVTETTRFELTPMRDFSIRNEFATNKGVDNRSTTANYVLPKALGNGLAGAKLTAALNTNTGGCQATTQASKIALDTSIDASRLLPLIARGGTSLHVETGHAQIGAWNGGKALSGDVRAVKLSGALASYREAKWSYTYATQSPVIGNANLPAAHEFDFTMPIRKMSLGFYDHDQIDQGDGTFKHGAERRLSIGGLLRGALNMSADYTQGHDDTQACPTNVCAYGFHFWGTSGSLQNLDFQVMRRLEQQKGNGDDHSMVYKLNFNLPQTDTQKLALTCNVATNKYDNRPNYRDHIDATVGFDFQQLF